MKHNYVAAVYVLVILVLFMVSFEADANANNGYHEKYRRLFDFSNAYIEEQVILSDTNDIIIITTPQIVCLAWRVWRLKYSPLRYDGEQTGTDNEDIWQYKRSKSETVCFDGILNKEKR